MNENIYALFESRFPEDRSKLFLDCVEGRDYSYDDLDHETAKVAGLLRQLGVQPGDRVAAQVDKCADNIFLYLGCLRAGATYLPLNTAYTASEVEYFLKDAKPVLVVCRPENLDAIRQIAIHAHVKHILALDPDGGGSFQNACALTDPWYDIAERSAADLAGICYTSGTTGRSKGAMLSHGNLAANALTLHRIWGWRDGDILLHALPIFHVHGLFIALHCALLNGSTVILMNKFDPHEVVRQLPRSTVFMGVPTFYTRLLALGEFDKVACQNMRLFISGSAPLLEETFNRFQEKTGHTILERYGMTEAGMITSNPYDGERIAGTVGPPLPDVDVRVTDEQGKILTPGEIGVLEIKGPNVFLGYWQMPDKTADEFRDDGFFITGDMAKVTESGVVTIVGRSKDLVISGGYNVYPKEVELVLDDIPGIEESAVIGVPHPDLGEAVIAVVTAQPLHEVPPEDEVIRTAREKLASFKTPKTVITVDRLPRNSMGKVQKNLLREQFDSLFDTDD